MQIYHGSLSMAILEFLNRYGDIPRKNLATPFASFNYSYYASTIKQLIAVNYVEVFRYKQANHLRITERGKRELGELLGSHRLVEKDTAKPPKTKQEKSRLALVVDVIGLAQANDVRVNAGEKPSLTDFFQHPLSVEDKEYLEECLEDGIFYSSKEIRTTYMELFGKNEIANLTRFIGIVLKQSPIPGAKGCVSFIYSTSDRLIQWSPACEDRTVKNIMYMLASSAFIQEHFTVDGTPNCIVCGRGYSMIPKIVFGRKYGHKNENPGKEKFQSRIAQNHINSHNLGKVFPSAHYVTVDKRGAKHFRIAIVLSEEVKDRLINPWYSQHADTVTRIRTQSHHQGMNNQRERVICMPYIDLIELEFLKNQGLPCHVIIESGLQENISRVLGPLLLSATDFTGNTLTYNSYDERGIPITKD